MKTYSLNQIKRGLQRRYSRALKLHPTSHPYISGDTFRDLAQHILDIDSTINPKVVRDGDIVFVQSFRVLEFFNTIHPHINATYTLITHNGDENITLKHTAHLDEKVRHWFAQNCLIEHPKITPIPIGLENKWYYQHGIPSYFDTLRKEEVVKKSSILYKFNVSTNPKVREGALTALQASPLADTYNDWRESWEYLRTLQSYQFVASPPGNGEDCHRTWEAMYLDTIPIVKRSAFTDHFTSLGLPLLVIDNWPELERISQETLENTYATMITALKTPALQFKYWKTLIHSYKK